MRGLYISNEIPLFISTQIDTHAKEKKLSLGIAGIRCNITNLQKPAYLNTCELLLK